MLKKNNHQNNLRLPRAICGSKSVRGVVQLTPFRFLVAFVYSGGLSGVVNAHNRFSSFNWGKCSIVSSSYIFLHVTKLQRKIEIGGPRQMNVFNDNFLTVRAVVRCS